MQRRVMIIDFMHLAYKYAYGGARQLTATLKINGVPTIVDTTLPAYIIKGIDRWSHGGFYPTVVCFDGAGCSKHRKAYFNSFAEQDAEVSGYKGTREIQDSRFYEGINLTMNYLLKGGVCCLKADGYEADDLIKAAVDKAKETYGKDMPIDIVTGDADLVPLVDEQVSVFLQSRKMTWAVDKDCEKLHYMQITPDNYQEYMEGLTAFKNLSVPYNTVLLAKCLRGDKSDNVKGYPKFTPTKYNNLITQLEQDGYNLGELCRYGNPIGTICYRDTQIPIPEDKIDEVPRDNKMIIYSEPRECSELCNVLSDYLDSDIVDHVRRVYNGINLNCAFTGLPEGMNRRPAVIKADIKGYLQAELQRCLSELQIKLKIV